MNRCASPLLAGLLYVVGVFPLEAQTTPATKPPIRQAVIESADGSYRIRIFGRIQAQYQYTSPDEDTDLTLLGDTYANRAITGPVSVMRIRRARLGMEGNIFGPRRALSIGVAANLN